MGNCFQDEEPFVPYDQSDASTRRRSRGLTFEENIELIKYQKRLGIHVKQSQPSYPSIASQPVGKPISAPASQSNTFNTPSPYPAAYGGYPQMSQSAASYPSGYPAAGYPQPTPPKVEESAGILKWFGFGKK